MKPLMILATLCLLLVGCSSEPNASDFRGVHLGQSVADMSAALEKIGFKAVEQKPGRFAFLKPDAGEVCGEYQRGERDAIVFYPCFFGKPNDMRYAEFAHFLITLTASERDHDTLGVIGITKFGERVRIMELGTRSIAMVQKDDQKKPGT